MYFHMFQRFRRKIVMIRNAGFFASVPMVFVRTYGNGLLKDIFREKKIFHLQLSSIFNSLCNLAQSARVTANS